NGSRATLLRARARALGAHTERFKDAAKAYRALLTEEKLATEVAGDVLDSFEELLTHSTEHADYAAHLRWVYQYKVEHTPENERVPHLLTWSHAEEALSSQDRALDLYRKALAIDPENADALDHVARLALATGSVEEAIAALIAQRDRSEGSVQTALN